MIQTDKAILVVEDDPARIGLLRHAMAAWGPGARLHVARDGAEALAFLHREGAYTDSPRPQLVLLDLHMPGPDGRDVLRVLKADPCLRRIPVVVMSASDEEEDVASCYDLHANGYVVKAFTLEQLTHDLRAIAAFWLETARLTIG